MSDPILQKWEAWKAAQPEPPLYVPAAVRYRQQKQQQMRDEIKTIDQRVDEALRNICVDVVIKLCSESMNIMYSDVKAALRNNLRDEVAKIRKDLV